MQHGATYYVFCTFPPVPISMQAPHACVFDLNMNKQLTAFDEFS